MGRRDIGYYNLVDGAGMKTARCLAFAGNGEE